MIRKAILALILITTSATAQTVRVEQDAETGFWQLLVSDRPYFVHGAGGDKHLELLASLGGNTIRTWGADQLEPREWPDGRVISVMDRAHELGLKVCVGYWVEHPAHGFNYDDPIAAQKQLNDIRAFVNKWKDHPALLMWGVGNEVAGPDMARVFRELNSISREIKKIDPSHPTMTATAGIWPSHGALFNQYCPDIDILGVNAYAGLPAVPQELLRQGYRGPYLVTEYGPIGHWECAIAPWGAEIEQPSADKARSYVSFHHSAITSQPDRALGGFVFLWGQKQERTDTWYSMFLRSGEKVATVDELAQIWTGKYPDNRAPLVERITSHLFLAEAKPDSEHAATVVANDPESDALAYEWIVRRESSDKQHGGAFERAPEDVPGCVIAGEATNTVSIRVPSEPGAYRLHVYVRDGQGGAGTANIPFLIKD